MWYDVMVRANEIINGKQVVNTYRIHLQKLNSQLRSIQDAGSYVLGVIPIVKQKEEDRVPDISETYLRKDIDPRLTKVVGEVDSSGHKIMYDGY
jgi:hypothetical protein